jgi:hypothetical protein
VPIYTQALLKPEVDHQNTLNITSPNTFKESKREGTEEKSPKA